MIFDILNFEVHLVMRRGSLRLLRFVLVNFVLFGVPQVVPLGVVVGDLSHALRIVGDVVDSSSTSSLS